MRLFEDLDNSLNSVVKRNKFAKSAPFRTVIPEQIAH